MMQRYDEKPPIPNIHSDFFLTTRDTPRILRQNPRMPSISVADDDYFVLFPNNIWKFRKLFLSLQPEYYCQTLKNNDYEKKKGKFQC
jgi:hypothetical protein